MGATDLAYQIRAGNAVLGGHIPQFDSYTFSVAGTPWLDQQWGAQGILALVYRAGGWPGLAAFQGLLAGVLFSLVYLACRASGARQRDAALLTMGGFLVAVPGIAARPQLLAFPLFALVLWAVAGRDRHPTRMWLIPFATALCANLHGSFPVFLFVVGIAWLDDRRRRSKLARRTLAILGLSFLGTFANPFGYRVWTYVYSLSTNPVIRTTINEWEPTNLGKVSGWLTLISGLAVGGILIVRRKPVPWTALVSLAAFFVLAWTAQRAIVWWGLSTPVTMASILASQASLEGVAKPRQHDARERPGPARLVTVGLIAVIVILAPWWRANSFTTYLTAAPPGLTQAVSELPAGSRLMVHQPWGSWFEFDAPHDTVFVDSRIEILPEAIWEDYDDVAYAGAGWREVLDRWQVDAIVAAADWKLLPYLRADPAWSVMYEDADGVVFQRVHSTP